MHQYLETASSWTVLPLLGPMLFSRSLYNQFSTGGGLLGETESSMPFLVDLKLLSTLFKFLELALGEKTYSFLSTDSPLESSLYLIMPLLLSIVDFLSSLLLLFIQLILVISKGININSGYFKKGNGFQAGIQNFLTTSQQTRSQLGKIEDAVPESNQQVRAKKQKLIEESFRQRVIILDYLSIIQCHFLLITMKKFVYWYAYFDTIFTKKLPTANRALVSMYLPRYLRIPATTDKWPEECALLELCQCFCELEKFILEQKNWSESICTIDELNQVEADVTNVLLLLEMQKLYILEFWGSKRRVQASFTHLYAILQLFVGSIIPYQNMTLFQCKAANKLCVKIVNLQDLFKSLMKKINSICAYFLDSFFDEEDLILRNFFQNFVEFMKIIPKIKKTKMFHVSQLLKYIVIVNSIEIAGLNSGKQLRKYFRNQSNHPQKQSSRLVELRKVKSLSKLFGKIRIFNGWILRSGKKSSSCPHNQLSIDEHMEQYVKTKNMLCFLFPNWIRRHSIKHRKQSLPKLNISIMDTIKGKSSSEFKRPYSPGEQKKVKIRNKSATKSRLLLKSQSLVDNINMSPSKQGSLKPTASGQKNSNTSKMAFEEDEQSNVIEMIGSAVYIKQSAQEIMGKEPTSLFSVHGVKLMKKDEEIIESLRGEQHLLAELQNIIYS